MNTTGDQTRYVPTGHLIYRNGDQVLSVAVDAASNLTLARPRVLFEVDYVEEHYDVSPDGMQFVMFCTTKEASRTPGQVDIVFNWHEELKRLVPTR